MAKVLVTGASGFIGFHLVCALLDRGEEVTAMDRRPPSLWEPDRLGVRFLDGDVVDPGALPPPWRGNRSSITWPDAWPRGERPSSIASTGRGWRRCAGHVAAGNAAGARVALLDGRQRPGGTAAPARKTTRPSRSRTTAGASGRASWRRKQWGDRRADHDRASGHRLWRGDPHCLSIYRSVSLSHIHFVPGRSSEAAFVDSRRGLVAIC